MQTAMIPCVTLKHIQGVMQKTLYCTCLLVSAEGSLLIRGIFEKYVNLVRIAKHAKTIRNLSLLWLSVMGAFCVIKSTGDLDMYQSILEPMFVVQAKIFQNWQVSRCLQQLFNVQKVCRDEVPATLKSVKLGFMSFFNYFKTVAFLLVLQQKQPFCFY